MNQTPDAEHSEARSLQFGTRSLLVGTAFCALLVLVFQRFGAIWGVSTLWMLVLVAAHVLANARGSYQGTRRRFEQSLDSSASCLTAPVDLVVSCAPATRLRDQRRFGRMLLVATAGTAFAASLTATAALLLATQVDAGGIVLGGVSAAILGGLLGFVSASFAMVATGSFREAADAHRSVPASRRAKSA